MRIMMVCTGNICRSPVADVLLRNALPRERYVVESMGTHALVDRPMTEQAASRAIRLGAASTDVENHRARQMNEADLVATDLVLAMSREHRTRIVETAPTIVHRTFTLREFQRLSASLSDEELESLGAHMRSRRKKLPLLLERLRSQRSEVGAASGSHDDDIVDPYRRSDKTYDRSMALIAPAIDEVARALRLVMNDR